MDKLVIALVHMKMKLLAKKSNLEKARRLVKDAATKGAKIVVLPSMVNIAPFYLAYPPPRAKSIVRNQAERIPGSTTDYLSMTAVESGVYIIAGPIVERAGPRLFLSTIVVSPSGDVEAKYRKLALNNTDADLGISNGRELYIMEKMPRPLGLMAEDDLYHPEIARSLLLHGSTLFIASLRLGEDPEKTRLLLQARALENHVPILAVGGILETMDKYVEMPTMVISPDKGITEQVEKDETYILVEVESRASNQSDIVEAITQAKRLAQYYCRATRDMRIRMLR